MRNIWFCETGDNIALLNKSDILHSLRITFSTCQNVQFTTLKDDQEGVQIRVTGQRRDAPFDETHIFGIIQLYDEPTHL